MKVYLISIIALLFSADLSFFSNRANPRFSQNSKSQLSNQAVAQNKAEPSKNKSSSSQPQNRKLAINYGILDDDFYRPIASQTIMNQANEHLKAISNLCTNNASLKNKAFQLENALEGLRALSQKYLQSAHLHEKDEIFLRDIRHHFQREKLTYGEPITESLLRASDIRIPFKINYRMYYKLPPRISYTKFPDEWARQFYKSLNCLYSQL